MSTIDEAYNIPNTTLLTLIEAIQDVFTLRYQDAQRYKQGYISDCTVDIEELPRVVAVGARVRMVIRGQFRENYKAKEKTPIDLLSCEAVLAWDGLRLYLTPPDLTRESLSFRRDILSAISTNLLLLSTPHSFLAADIFFEQIEVDPAPSERPTPKGQARGGRPTSAANRWLVREVIEKGRAPVEVFPEWLERLGPEANRLADPRDSFSKVLQRARKKRINP